MSMRTMNEQAGGWAKSEILFSRSVKAGKRVYYIDVKQDRRGELYLSITENKRVRDGGEEARPVFEKHKIFLYREDLEKFMSAFGEAADYARRNAPGAADRCGAEDASSREAESGSLTGGDAVAEEENAGDETEETLPFRLDIEF